MITEDQLEQLAIQWLRDMARANIEHRTPNIEHRKEVKRRLTAEREALRTLTPALSQWEKEKERGGIRRLTPSISEEVSAIHKDSLSVEIKSK